MNYKLKDFDYRTFNNTPVLINKARSISVFDDWDTLHKSTLNVLKDNYKGYRGFPIHIDVLDMYYPALRTIVSYISILYKGIENNKVLYLDEHNPIAFEDGGRIFLIAPCFDEKEQCFYRVIKETNE